ncbi:hypothetical protein CC80DRAFT_244327 [Byssothecium circinans]|uniref:Uncharacterized protein n=1 Tax=Byssothecium circinans TaxID=147558 RepID=A0A6A5TCV0_9PLEO|nr:hypothetical protein CC80DRAFT_244327 [Byssothecium circinans]
MDQTNTFGNINYAGGGATAGEAPGEGGAAKATKQRGNTVGASYVPVLSSHHSQVPPGFAQASILSSNAPAALSATHRQNAHYEAAQALMGLQQVQEWNEHQSGQANEQQKFSQGDKRPPPSPELPQGFKVPRVQPREAARPFALYPLLSSAHDYGRHQSIPLFQGLQSEFSPPQPMYHGYGVLPPADFGSMYPRPPHMIPYDLEPIIIESIVPTQMPQTAQFDSGQDQGLEATSRIWPYHIQAGASAYGYPVPFPYQHPVPSQLGHHVAASPYQQSEVLRRSSVLDRRAANTLVQGELAVSPYQTVQPQRSTSMDLGAANYAVPLPPPYTIPSRDTSSNTSSPRPRPSPGNSKPLDKKSQRKQEAFKKKADALRQRRASLSTPAFAPNGTIPHHPHNMQLSNAAGGGTNVQSHSNTPLPIISQLDMGVRRSQSRTSQRTTDQQTVPHKPPSHGHSHAEDNGAAEHLMSLSRSRTQEPPVLPPTSPNQQPVQPVIPPFTQQVVPNYKDYLAPITLYKIDPKNTTHHHASAWLETLFIPTLQKTLTPNPRSLLSVTQGFIPDANTTHFIVLHNADDPFHTHTHPHPHPQTPAAHTTSIGCYGYYYRDPSAVLYWRTFVPGIEDQIREAEAEGMIREVRRWEADMQPRQRRFHKAYWKCARREPLGGLLNCGVSTFEAVVEEEREKEEKEEGEDIEELELSEEDVMAEWDVSDGVAEEGWDTVLEAGKGAWIVPPEHWILWSD